MGEPEYVVIINDSQTYLLKGDKTEAIFEAIKQFNAFWAGLRDEYARASDEDKKQYDEEAIFGSASEVNLIRVFYVDALSTHPKKEEVGG